MKEGLKLVVSVALLLIAVECVDAFNINNMNDFWTFYYTMKNGTFNSDVELNCDLDFDGVYDFLPIGQINQGNGTFYHFNNKFQGNGHSIKNLVINASLANSYDAGFFICLGDSRVSDLHIDKSCSFSGAWAGALAVKTNRIGNQVIKNVSNSATVIGGGVAGGIIGKVYGDEVSFEGCWNDGPISVANTKENYRVDHCGGGGIVGVSLSRKATFFSCQNYGPVNVELMNSAINAYGSNAGGIIGAVRNCDLYIESCSNHATIHAHTYLNTQAQNRTAASGGVVGYFESNTDSKRMIVKNCFNDGNITSSSDKEASKVFASGIVGVSNFPKNVNIEECYNIGNVRSSASKDVPVQSAGIICTASSNRETTLTVTHCDNEGMIESMKDAYGIVDLATTVNYCMNSGAVNGKEKSYGIAREAKTLRYTMNAGEVVCNNESVCVCGVSGGSNSGLIYRDTNGCEQQGGSKMLVDDKGMPMMETSEHDTEYISDVMNNNLTIKPMNGMLWSRDMKLGYKLTMELCERNGSYYCGRGYVVVRPRESIRSSIEREGDEMNDILNRVEHVLMIDGNEVHLNDTIRCNSTVVIHELNGCAMFVCSDTTVEPVPYKACEDKHKPCYKGVCNISNGHCESVKIDGWDELVKQEGYCYEVVCSDNETKWIMKEKEESIIWENQTNDCVTYQCNNELGLIAWSMCNSTVEGQHVCVNNKCVKEKSVSDVYVEVELKEGVEVKDIDIDAIVEALKERVNIGWESDVNGHIIRVMIYVEDEQIAQIIANKIEKVEKGEDCPYNVLCRAERVRVRTVDDTCLSLSSGIVEKSTRIVLILILMIMIML